MCATTNHLFLQKRGAANAMHGLDTLRNLPCSCVSSRCTILSELLSCMVQPTRKTQESSDKKNLGRLAARDASHL